jgi:hypothetical protein
MSINQYLNKLLNEGKIGDLLKPAGKDDIMSITDAIQAIVDKMTRNDNWGQIYTHKYPTNLNNVGSEDFNKFSPKLKSAVRFLESFGMNIFKNNTPPEFDGVPPSIFKLVNDNKTYLIYHNGNDDCAEYVLRLDNYND